MMWRALASFVDQHDLRLLAVAACLCAFASWTAVTLLSRARVSDSDSKTRNLWILGAGTVFGSAVWATHFIAMLAFQSNLPITYDISWTLLSVVVAVSLSTCGYALVFRPRWALIGGAIVGLAIAAMHYIGMWGMEGPFDLAWRPLQTTASVAIGVVGGTLAVLGGTRIRNVRGRATAAAVLTLAVFSTHFMAMSALRFLPHPILPFHHAVFAPGMLAITVAAVVVLVVALGLVSAHLDRHLELRRTGEEARLRAYVVELENTKTELGGALREASAASDAKMAFLAAMSHELRTPLNAVIGFSEIMASEAFGPLGNERYKIYSKDVHSSGTRLLSVINDILELARLDAGKATLVETPVSVGDILHDVANMVEAQAAVAGISVSLVVPDLLPCLLADERRLRQVFLNLLSNAVKFTPQGGHVGVCAEFTASSLIVRISDTGIGIADEDVDRALERFGQIDSRLARKYEGTGLGLPLAKHLTELHDGTLSIASKLGEGTTITLSFPASRVVNVSNIAA